MVVHTQQTYAFVPPVYTIIMMIMIMKCYCVFFLFFAHYWLFDPKRREIFRKVQFLSILSKRSSKLYTICLPTYYYLLKIGTDGGHANARTNKQAYISITNQSDSISSPLYISTFPSMCVIVCSLLSSHTFRLPLMIMMMIAASLSITAL